MTARMMEHEEAMKNLVAERYLLGELTENDREAYEEHLFSCPVCFEQVKAGTEFVGHLRMGVDEPRPTPVWRKVAHSVFRPATSLAFAVLLLCTAGLNIYQSALLHRPRDPQVVASVTLKPDSRGEIKVVTASRRGNFELRFLVPYSDEITVWQTRILDASGTEKAPASIPAQQNGEGQILYDAKMFQSGQYLLEVRGTNRTTGSTELLRQFPFKIQLRD